MKIAILANSDIGLYKFRKELVEQLCIDNEVYIILPKGEFIDRLKGIGCKYIQFDFNRRGMNPVADLKQLKNYLQILKNINPGLVLTYTIKPNVYGGIACKKLRIPCIANITGLGTSIENGGFVAKVSTTLYKIGLKEAECVFFQNIDNKNFFEKKKIVEGRTRLIPGSGVNLETHTLEPYPEDKDGIRFLFVGRIMKDKGIEELLSAISDIHKANGNVVVDIVGFCDEDFSEQLKKAEAEGSIVFYGLQSDVHPFYKKCHCAVLPSYHEGMANVMLEAASTGRPVITTKVPGCQETFDEGVTGFGCEVKDTDSLKSAMLRFLNLSQEKRKEMGLAARRKMEREFDRNLVIESYQEEIERITQQ